MIFIMNHQFIIYKIDKYLLLYPILQVIHLLQKNNSDFILRDNFIFNIIDNIF